MTDGTQHNPPAGWHDDPDDSTQLRYWDGQQWTDHRSPKNGTAAAHAAAPSGAATSGTKSGFPWWAWLIIALVALPVVIIVLLVIIGIAVDDDSDTSGAADDVVVTESSEPSETPVTEEEPAPSPSPEQEGGTAASPLPLNTPWWYDSSWFGEEATVWDGSFDALVELPLSSFDDDEGARCFALTGTITPTSIADEAFTTNIFDTPDFELIVSGAVQDEFGFCDYDALEAEGYNQLLDASVSLGTDYRFFDTFYLPSTVSGNPELVVLGSASDSDSLFFEAEVSELG